MTENVETIHCETADDLLETLAPRGSSFGNSYLPDSMIFRGHGDCSWPLLPTAFRGTQLSSFARYSASTAGSNEHQIRAEATALQEFLKVADRSGLPLPEDSQTLREQLSVISDGISFGSSGPVVPWPPTNVLALLAIAQHHGLPTRLLDWSWSAHVAAYFAAKGAVMACSEARLAKKAAPDKLCIWAMARSLFDVSKLLPRDESNAGNVELVTTPAAGNPNLRAQRGLFLLYRPPSLLPNEPADKRPWDVLLPLAYQFMKESKFLIKITLPTCESPRLLRLLALEGVNASGIFPGYDGVVSSLQERSLWESGEEFHRRNG